MKKVLIAGLVASVAMAMVEMIYEGFFGVGFWSAPVFIAATILRSYQAVALPVTFAALPAVLGLMGHMMNSVVLGLAFVMIFRGKLASRTAGMGYGISFALSVFFLMWFIVLPVIDPVMLNLNPYVFAMAHLVWGAVLGYMVASASVPHLAPASQIT